MKFVYITVICLVLLFTLNSSAQIHIAGQMSGVLEDTTYIVDDYLRVLSGDTLTIQPGATFLFAGYYQLQIFGLLIAVGTEEDSIYFQPLDSTVIWGCICFDNCDENSQLSYCYVTSCALGAVNSLGADITVSHCTLEGNTGSWGGGIYLSYAHANISGCKITGNSVVSCGGGIYATHSNPQISDCIISGNHCGGSGSGTGGGGVCFNHSSSGILTGSLIFENSSGQYGGGISCSDMSNAEIRNCTISENSAVLSGGGMDIYSSIPEVSNNIFAANNGDGGIHFDITAQVSLIHNDFHDNENGDFSGDVPPGLGEIVTQNLNGDSCDTGMNIYLDPLFTDPAANDFHLSENSPCIDAGDPLSPLDPDGTIADIGAFCFGQTPPAPVVDDLTVTISNNDVILHWSPFTYAISYNIYRSEEPYFDVSTITPAVTVTEPEFIGLNAAAENIKYFYIVTANTP